jgi:hypothetical protein
MKNLVGLLSGCLVIVFVLALAVGILGALGWVLSWVLGFFGLVVPWYVCAVIWFLLGAVGSTLRGGK